MSTDSPESYQDTIQDRVNAYLAVCTGFTDSMVRLTESIYAGELKLAQELGAENYAATAKSNISSSEKVSLAVTDSVTTIGRETIKMLGPHLSKRSEARFLEAQARLIEAEAKRENAGTERLKADTRRNNGAGTPDYQRASEAL